MFIMFYSPLEQFDAIAFITLALGNYDITITSILIPLFILILLLIVYINFYIREFKLIPDFWQYIFENVYLFVFNIIDQQIGYKGYIYFPLIFTLFFFILICNLISMSPFGIALTSHIVLIMFLSLGLGIALFLIGMYNFHIQFLKLFIPECPFILLPFLILIEIFSYVIKSFSLAIRLSANIMAGHTLVYIISSFLLNMLYLKFVLFCMFSVLILAVLLLEVGVAFLQAYVFTILICIYLSDSVKQVSH